MRKAYLIAAPGWTHISSGPRALHWLCHYLNEAGEDAYILPQSGKDFALNPKLKTKLISPEYANYYGEDMVVVYPDVIKGNPVGAKYVCRWLLAPAGLYGGDSTFPETDKVWCYRSDIAMQQKTDKILLIPTINPSLFFDKKLERHGTCYYAHKFDKIHNNVLPDIVKGSTRLEGSPEYIASVLQRSEKMYLLEPSEIYIHALMCGCSVEEVRSHYFPKSVEHLDCVKDGVLISVEEMMEISKIQLQRFIEDTQVWTISHPNRGQ